MLISQQIQFGMMVVTSLLFAAAFLLGLQHMRRAAEAGPGVTGGPRGMSETSVLPHETSMGGAARSAVILGVAMGIALLIWRLASQGSLALEVSNPLDAFLVLGLVLAGALGYFRWTRHLRSLSFFLLPMIVILLLLGVILTALHPDKGGAEADATRRFHDVWIMVHVVTIVAGTVCFALGCVGSAVYLLADRQLRRKGLDQTHRWTGLPPLASIEKLNQWMIFLGFPLLTVATFAGVLIILQGHGAAADGAAAQAGQALKIGCGFLAWAVYAVLLHVPLNPRFRGRRAAWLSIVGFVLFIGAFAAAKWS